MARAKDEVYSYMITETVESTCGNRTALARKPLFMKANSRAALSEILRNILYGPGPEDYECETDPPLLKFISHNSSASPCVKWLVSSRNRLDIDQQLKLRDSRMEISLELTQKVVQVSSAVDAYIDARVSELAGSIKNTRDVEVAAGQAVQYVGRNKEAV